MDKNQKYALVTGASMGIGRAMAVELAKRNHNVLLIALDTLELEETRKYISDNFQVKVEAFGVDLTTESAVDKVYEWCEENKFSINILINNAGFGEGGLFEDIDIDRYCTMIDLNNKSYIRMIHKFLPDLKKLGKEAHIMNTSSMEAILPLPYKSVYTGTKNFIYAFSLALNEELRSFGVRVSILCPGPVLTNKGGLERINAMGKKAMIILMMPDQVAKVAIRHMLNGMLVIIPGKLNWWISKLVKCIPTKIKMRILERMFKAYK